MSSKRPPSVVSVWVTTSAAVVFVAAVFLLRWVGLDLTGVVLGSMAIFIVYQACLELFVRKVHRNPSTGLVFSRDQFRANFSIPRTLVKLAGFYLTIGVLALIYWLVPLYSRELYRPMWDVLRMLAPWAIPLNAIYFLIIDALMANPRDGNWQTANVFALRWRHIDPVILREHAKGWAIKGYFLTLMLPYLFEALVVLEKFGKVEANSLIKNVYYIGAVMNCIDLAFVVTGYTFTVRILDSHIRNANYYVSGWAVCIVMYYPFWQMVAPNYLDGLMWYDWFGGSTVLMFVWAAAILTAKTGWAWASVIFGFRWSNLTHRGIITNGPYRFTKHPCYICKNLGWWLTAVPFLAASGPLAALQYSAALVAVNVVYLGRAKTEEMHLSADPDYVAYAEWINEHGIFRWVTKIVPAFYYVAPTSCPVPEPGEGAKP
jgi:hypothetical protein